MKSRGWSLPILLGAALLRTWLLDGRTFGVHRFGCLCEGQFVNCTSRILQFSNMANDVDINDLFDNVNTGTARITDKLARVDDVAPDLNFAFAGDYVTDPTTKLWRLEATGSGYAVLGFWIPGVWVGVLLIPDDASATTWSLWVNGFDTGINWTLANGDFWDVGIEIDPIADTITPLGDFVGMSGGPVINGQALGGLEAAMGTELAPGGNTLYSGIEGFALLCEGDAFGVLGVAGLPPPLNFTATPSVTVDGEIEFCWDDYDPANLGPTWTDVYGFILVYIDEFDVPTETVIAAGSWTTALGTSCITLGGFDPLFTYSFQLAANQGAS